MTIKIKLSNKVFYSLISLMMAILLIMGVYAVPGVSHPFGEVGMPSCATNEVLNWDGTIWNCAEQSEQGEDTKLDPLVVKEWADDVDDDKLNSINCGTNQILRKTADGKSWECANKYDKCYWTQEFHCDSGELLAGADGNQLYCCGMVEKTCTATGWETYNSFWAGGCKDRYSSDCRFLEYEIRTCYQSRTLNNCKIEYRTLNDCDRRFMTCHCSKDSK